MDTKARDVQIVMRDIHHDGGFSSNLGRIRLTAANRGACRPLSCPYLLCFVALPESITDEVLGWTTHSLAKKRNRNQFLYQLRLAPEIQSIDEALAECGSPFDSFPIQIYWGRHDPLFPTDYAYHLRDRLETGPTKVFEHSGHIPQIEEPKEFNRALRSFLKGDGDM